MTFDQIISDLYISPDLDRCIAKQVRREDWDDFKQELFTIICALDKNMVVDLSKQGRLKFYVVRVIINLSNQKNASYQRKYKSGRTIYDTDMVQAIQHPAEHNTMQERQAAEDREQRMLNEVENLDKRFGTFYHRVLVQQIAECGSQREVSRRTGIPIASISVSVKRVREYLSTL